MRPQYARMARFYTWFHRCWACLASLVSVYCEPVSRAGNSIVVRGLPAAASSRAARCQRACPGVSFHSTGVGP
eukprot:5390247-Prymnesium_polylepis.1